MRLQAGIYGLKFGHAILSFLQLRLHGIQIGVRQAAVEVGWIDGSLRDVFLKPCHSGFLRSQFRFDGGFRSVERIEIGFCFLRFCKGCLRLLVGSSHLRLCGLEIGLRFCQSSFRRLESRGGLFQRLVERLDFALGEKSENCRSEHGCDGDEECDFRH